MTYPINEITILMAINSVGIIAIMGMFIHLSLVSIFGKKTDSLDNSHYSRNQ
jgi:hypothetical protein